jgi:hypothetical protein
MKNWVFILLATLPFLRAQSQRRNDPGDPNHQYSADGFPIVSRLHELTPILIDSNDSWLAGKAAILLQADIERVTGYRVPILTSLPGGSIPFLIVIGSLDQSPTMQYLARTNRISADRLKGKWESYSIRTINTPWSNVGKALVITGSDRRGTAYGVFDLSRQIGVSPWYWWADVPVRKIDPLYVPFQTHVVGPPSVKYRGFFINDEAPALSGWTREKFGGFNHTFYEKVFELLLRLKGNYLWPAMWGSAFNDDDPDNPVLASKYGIVMGTSHHEPMLRAQQEWKRYGSGPWNYETNAKVLDSFWEKGIAHMDHHESIVTVGMRGDGDKPMTEGSNIALLEKIVNDQRAIIQKVTGRPPSATPQSWALYKEVQDYYDKGMRVPDDVTLLLCDDNWGNVRKLPLQGEKPRGGGYGMYYHFDYVGGPRNYKWINTNPIARTWEQMHLTKEYGADQIWIVNVGDIKPMEFPLQFFLDYAWAPSRLPAGRLPEYTRQWAAEQFGPSLAAPIADILTKYTKYNGRRKPELLSPDTYSLFNYREAETVVSQYNYLAQQADSIYQKLPEEYKDAYYQLVLYPVQASANLNELYVTVANNRLYAAQGRAAANGLAEKARALFDKDSVLSHYYNKLMSYGKWDHMMDQTHIGYTYWQEPRHNNMPEIKTLDLSSITGSPWGVTVEGSSAWWPGTSDTATAVLPVFDANDHEDHFIEIFNRTQKPFSYTVTPVASWLQVSRRNGSVDQQDTLWIAIDWLHAPAGKQETSLIITGPDGRQVSVKVRVNNPSALPSRPQGFVEANGYVSIEAEHFLKAATTPGITWQVIPDLGRTLSGVEAAPVTAAAQIPGGNSPHLEYPLYLFDTGAFHIKVYLSPLLEFNRKKIHYGISFDDDPPQIIDCSTGNEDKGTWDKMVADNIRVAVSVHRLTLAGRHVLKFWMVDPGVVLQKIVVDAGGVKPSYLGPPESPHFRLNSNNR